MVENGEWWSGEVRRGILGITDFRNCLVTRTLDRRFFVAGLP